jgi:hypothetical protein
VDQIETLAMSNPSWITTRNNAGYSPIQIICKSGRIDEETISVFSRIGGPNVFAVVDLMGNTPLHSAMRVETECDALMALMKAYPEALHMRTMYDDTPLHLACLRCVDMRMLREVALASSLETSSNARLSPLLIPNTAGQTPISIAIDEYNRICQNDSRRCCVQGTSHEQSRAFDVLATLVEILHYGPRVVLEGRGQNLVGACIALHRKDVRLDPAFIRRALCLRPQDARQPDEDGNYPLHIEASIPVEKMSLLDAPRLGCCNGVCHKRIGVLRMLLDMYPEVCRKANRSGDFPISLMIQSGRQWESTFSLIVQQFPEGLHSVPTVTPSLMPRILEKLSNQCGSDSVFFFLSNLQHISH